MKHYKFAFYISEKSRTHNWGQMLAEGARAHGDVVHVKHQTEFVEPLQDYDGAANLGMARACKRLYDAHLGGGKHFIYFDKGYLGPRNVNWRFSVDGWQPLAYFQRFKRASDRLDKLDFRMEKKRKPSNGHKIVLAGACQNYHNFFDLGNVNEWCLNTTNKIAAETDREIVYRPNPSWARKHADEFAPIKGTTLSPFTDPFNSVLAECQVMISHGSSVNVGALAGGVPVITLGDGVAKGMGLSRLPTSPVLVGDHAAYEDDQLYWPHDRDRYQFFCDLAYQQWSMDEYRSGAAWEEIRLALAFIEGGQEASDLIGQYRTMHKSPKYFRGLSVVKYADRIAKLVAKTGSKSVLDYGCGKGQQYETPHEIHKTWGFKPALYDPGVPAFAQMPSGVFDGVVCVDVMEHIPEQDVVKTIIKIISTAKKFVFFVIAGDPANKTLPDGRNCHLTVQPPEWWEMLIAKAQSEYGAPGLVVKTVVTFGENDHG